MPRFARHRCAWFSALALLLVGCSGGPAQPHRSAPVMLLAVDGLEWSVLLPLLAGGELPTLQSWIEGGQAGLLDSMKPTKSPVIWTTVATGRTPKEHGILDFIKKDGEGGRQLYTSADRKAAALWNMTSWHGLRSAVFGWWMTYPVEAIEGIMVAQVNTLPGQGAPGGGVWKGALQEGLPRQVFPTDSEPLVERALARADRDLDSLITSVFGDFREPMPKEVARFWEASRWSLRADAVYLAIAKDLLRQRPGDFDLVMLYLGGADVMGHRFWRYREPEAYENPPSPEDVREFGSILEDYYRYLDRALGELRREMEGDWNVVLVSDHGMRAFHQDGAFDPEADLGKMTSGHHLDAPPGVVIASGPDIRRAPLPAPLAQLSREELLHLGGVYDVTPTVLALLGLPLAEDMAGNPLEHLFAAKVRSRARPAKIASYDEGYSSPEAISVSDADDRERLEQLKALGYISDD